MPWRLANSLVTLRDQVDALAPRRGKSSDGTIGDAAHAARHSDHNPNGAGVVCAFDITHDSGRGLDMGPISEWMRTHRHPSLTYLIFNRRIAGVQGGWAWEPYGGASPHTEHCHVSASHDYDNGARWSLPGDAPPPPPPPPNPNAAPPFPGDMRLGAFGDGVTALQDALNRVGAGLASDGKFGPKTDQAVRNCQVANHVVVDGIVGPITWNALWAEIHSKGK